MVTTTGEVHEPFMGLGVEALARPSSIFDISSSLISSLFLDITQKKYSKVFEVAVVDDDGQFPFRILFYL